MEGAFHQSTPRPAVRRRGLTLAETLLAAVILAGAVLAFWTAVNAGRTQARDSDQARWAVALGDEMIERMLALPYADPDGLSVLGPEVGETPPSGFDNADDYHGYAESAGNIRDRAGSPLPPQYQALSRSVTVQYTPQTVASLTSSSIAGLTVAVTVRGSNGFRLTLTRFIREPTDGN